MFWRIPIEVAASLVFVGKLREYVRKRDFTRTAEPAAKAPARRAQAKQPRFVVQEEMLKNATRYTVGLPALSNAVVASFGREMRSYRDAVSLGLT